VSVHAPRHHSTTGRGLRAVQRTNRRAWDWADSWRHKARKRVGYRGMVLLLFGTIYIFIGLAVIGADDYRPELIHTHLPTFVRVLIWDIPGLVAVGVAIDDKMQAWGFGLLFIPPAERAVSFLVAAVTVPTWQRVPGLLIYLLLVVVIAVMAAWPDAIDVEHSVLDQVEAKGLVELTHEDHDKYLDAVGELHGDRERKS
jgi:hypothetical protein